MYYHQELLKAYRTVQMSGRVNMLIRDEVRELAEAYRLHDLVEFIDDFDVNEYIAMQKKIDWDTIEPYDDVLQIMK